MTDKLLQIGEVAERVGLSLRTVRYYEEMGLLTPQGRTDGGFRLYTEEQVERLRLIKQMKPLGFTVQEIRDLLDTSDALSDDDAEPETRDAAIERMREFATDAERRCDELRVQLARAEEFAKQLRARTRGRRTPATKN